MNIYAQITIQDWFDYPKPRDRGWTAIYTLINCDGEYCWGLLPYGKQNSKPISATLNKLHKDIVRKGPGTYFLFEEGDLENLCQP